MTTEYVLGKVLTALQEIAEEMHLSRVALEKIAAEPEPTDAAVPVDPALAENNRVVLEAEIYYGDVDDLPAGMYFDGTYDWLKEDEYWTPLNSPSGMPSRPSPQGLLRVISRHVPAFGAESLGREG